MSKLLTKYKNFILFILDKNSSNAALLLRSITKDQSLALSEIIHNLIAGTIPLSREKLLKLRRNKTILRRLAKKEVSLSSKKTIITKHPAVILSVLKLIERELLTLLS